MTPYYADGQVTLHLGDALDVAQELPAGSADCIVTSPPYYGLRDYGTEGQYGLEESPAAYVSTMANLFFELRRVLADDGTLWLNIGDSYAIPRGGGYNSTAPSNQAGSKSSTSAGLVDYRDRPPTNFDRKPKNLLGIPWRVAFALQDDGWILRNAIIWNKPNAMPESVTDRLSGRYEHVFLFSKSRRYWFDLDPIRDGHTSEYSTDAISKAGGVIGGVRPIGNNFDKSARHSSATSTPRTRAERAALLNPAGRNPGDVWSIPTQPFSAAHFAVFPVQLAQRCIQAGCKPGGTVLDPFSGSGTTGVAAQRTGRKYVGIDLNREYLELSLNHPQRLNGATLDFQEGA